MEYKASIIGRRREQEILQKCYDSDKAEFVAVYGRRRVGKTFLVNELFGDKFDFYASGIYQIARDKQLSEFSRQIASYSGKKKTHPMNWFEAFDCLKEYLSTLKKERILVFIDELPWFDTPKSDFIRALESFWNMWGSTVKGLKLIVCGSATTWMVDKLLGDKGGLHNRVTRRILLYPFNLYETEQYLCSTGFDWDRQQIMQCYMALGGTPYYLQMLDKDYSIMQNIDRLFFTMEGELRSEYDFLYRSLFNDAKLYTRVVELLASKLKGLTRKEIVSGLKVPDNQALTKVLENLCRCDFLRMYHPYGGKKKGALYQLSDMYSLFYLRFVGGNHVPTPHAWTLMRDQKRESWYGYAFEQVCLHHIEQIKRRLGISGIESDVSAWSYVPKNNDETGGQIDLVIQRADRVINLCEMKYSSVPFVIKTSYMEEMRVRRELFRSKTKTSYTLSLTMVSPYGVQGNKYAGDLGPVVTMDDLFASE